MSKVAVSASGTIGPAEGEGLVAIKSLRTTIVALYRAAESEGESFAEVITLSVEDLR